MENWRIFGEEVKPGEVRRMALRVPMGGLANRGEVMPGTGTGDGYELPAILINGNISPEVPLPNGLEPARKELGIVP